MYVLQPRSWRGRMVGKFGAWGRLRMRKGKRLIFRNSCAHQANEEVISNQVQGPLPTTPVHPCLEGCRESREVEGISTTQ